MKKITLIITAFAIAIALPAEGKRLHLEKEYQDIWCAEAGGVTEVRLEEGSRVDCVTDEYAIEFDFANKWTESGLQAALYSIETGKKPGIVLIVEDPEKDQVYVDRLRKVLEAMKKCTKNLKLWVITPDIIPGHKEGLCHPLDQDDS